MNGDTASGFEGVIASLEELREMVRPPGELVQRKALNALDSHCVSLIGLSSLLLVASSDARGCCDVSPRGDPAGFVQVLDAHRLLIPDRPGNRRLDTMENILANPRVGLLFVIPGMEETLRVNGRACIVRDERLLAASTVNNKAPRLGIGVTVEEAYIHCAKSFRRGGIWQPDSWPSTHELPSIGTMLLDHAKPREGNAADIDELLARDYSENMY